jgi:hypothetical protein
MKPITKYEAVDETLEQVVWAQKRSWGGAVIPSISILDVANRIARVDALGKTSKRDLETIRSAFAEVAEEHGLTLHRYFDGDWQLVVPFEPLRLSVPQGDEWCEGTSNQW